MKNNVKLSAVKLLLIAFFAVSVVLPLLSLFIKMGSVDFIALLCAEKTKTAIIHSLFVSLTATAFSVIIAFIAAWLINRVCVKLKNVFNVLITLPMLVPSISHGMGLVIILGSNGKLTKLLGLSKGIYGFTGIVIGSVMYAFPVAFLMISDILKYEDATPYEAAKVLGIPSLRRFTAITFPYLRKPMVSVIFATFTLIITDYGVPLMVGGVYKTLPVLMYEDAVGSLDFAKGSVYGAVLLVPAIAAFIIDIFCKDTKKSGYIIKPIEEKRSPLAKAIAYVYFTVLSVCVVYPIISFILISFSESYPRDLAFTLRHIISSLDTGAGRNLTHSLIISFGVSALGVVFAFLGAYLAARSKGVLSKAVHLLSIIPLAVPGLVLGLSYVFMFKGSFIYRTLFILMLVNIIHFFSSPYLMMYNTLGKLNTNLEAVGNTLGISRLHMIFDVFIPQVRSTLIEMFTYFFVNSMMTISAVSFLSSTRTKPLSLMIPQFQDQFQLESAAFVSLIILVVNLLIKGVSFALKYFMSKKLHRALTAPAD